MCAVPPHGHFKRIRNLSHKMETVVNFARRGRTTTGVRARTKAFVNDNQPSCYLKNQTHLTYGP